MNQAEFYITRKSIITNPAGSSEAMKAFGNVISA